MKQLALLVLVACSADRVPPDGAPASGVHPAGYADEKSASFHATDIPRRGYDLNLCASCHGADFAGGAAGVTCLECHPQGPTACVTCHRDGPTSNAHVVHRDVGKLACAECHVVPARWDAPGHFQPAALVTFGARANLTLAPADRTGPAAYADGRCTNVYCHGDALHAAGGTATAPRWDAPTAPGSCTGCHAAPPPSHAQTACATCHPASAPHIDGVVDVGTTSGCSGCHGDATSAAPPNDLAGNVYTTALGVGAHRAHLTAPSHLRGPIACATCHLVPATVDAAGHIDSPLPAEVDATLGWDRTAATCATAWCHGPARPVWTQRGGVACGSCHGVPPADAAHTPGMPLTSCASCHPRTMSPDGNLLPGEHMDGDVDVL